MSAAVQDDGRTDWDALAALPRWVAWRTEPRKAGERPTKVPKNPHTLGNAASDAPHTWGARVEAEAADRRLPPSLHGPGGIGIMLGEAGDGRAIGGVDLDSCRDPATDAVEPWAEEVLALLNTYAEISPSGTGVKALFQMRAGTVDALRETGLLERPDGFGRSFKRGNGSDHPPAIEAHLGRRYYAVTGQRLDAAPERLRIIGPEELRRLLGEIGPAFAAAAKGKGGSAAPDRSAKAFRLAREMRRSGRTYGEFAEALDDDPDTAAWKREKGAAGGGREMRRAWDRAAGGGKKAEGAGALVTEDAVALAFAERHRHDLRFCHTAGAWYRWTGAVWRREETKLAYRWARDAARELAEASGNEKAVLAAGRAAFAAGVERFCQADEAFAVTSALWDPDPMLLGTPGGTVDLRTGSLRPARQADHITRSAAVAPAETADCATWLAFLEQATGGDRDLVGFLRRWFGYCLTGLTQEHALLFVYGPGGNGKGVLLNTVAAVMGSYATTAAMDTFTATQGDRAPGRPGDAPRRADGDDDRDRGGPRVGGGADQGPDGRRSDHGAVHAARLLHLHPRLQADHQRQPQAGAAQRGRRRAPPLQRGALHAPAGKPRPGAAREAAGRVPWNPALADRGVPGMAGPRARAAGGRVECDRRILQRPGRARAVGRGRLRAGQGPRRHQRVPVWVVAGASRRPAPRSRGARSGSRRPWSGGASPRSRTPPASAAAASRASARRRRPHRPIGRTATSELHHHHRRRRATLATHATLFPVSAPYARARV
jgi:hypothetical protein